MGYFLLCEESRSWCGFWVGHIWNATGGDKPARRQGQLRGGAGSGARHLVLCRTVIGKALRTQWGHVLLLLIKNFCFLEDTGLIMGRKSEISFKAWFCSEDARKCLCKSHPHEKEGNRKGVSVKIHHMESLVSSLILPLLTHPSTHPLPSPISGESQ